MKLNSRFLGKVKVWQTRIASYASMVSFGMVLYLFIIESPLGLKWYIWIILIGLLTVGTVALDILYIFPSAQKYIFDKNPEMVELRKKIDKILEHLNKEEK